uniref:Uncharacterized protein n=1 Tax=Ditylenchus dipsaci TaxID=166011 RepID=A0A915ET11_9BILA
MESYSPASTSTKISTTSNSRIYYYGNHRAAQLDGLSFAALVCVPVVFVGVLFMFVYKIYMMRRRVVPAVIDFESPFK